MALSCPVCGSENVAITMSQRSIAAPLGPTVAFDVETDTCANCGESGDFAKRNDELIRDAEQKSAAASVESLLGSLSHSGRSMAYMERALSLPPRTIGRWKGGETSAAAMALMRCVFTYPWLLEVADARFSPRIASAKLVMEAGRVLGNAFQVMFTGPTTSTYNASMYEADRVRIEPLHPQMPMFSAVSHDSAVSNVVPPAQMVTVAG
jgi:hypothetical protein